METTYDVTLSIGSGAVVTIETVTTAPDSNACTRTVL